MNRRTLTIIIGSVFFILGVPLIFMWSFVSSGSNNRFWQIDKAGLYIINKDSLQAEYYHFSNLKSGLDTFNTHLLLMYFDTDFYAEPIPNTAMLSASQKPGYMGNPQKIKTIKVFASHFYKTNYMDISNTLTNDSIPNYNELTSVNFQLYKNYHGEIGYQPHLAYVFNDVKHLVYFFNHHTSHFDEIGDDNTFIKFKIDKNVFRKFGRLFKLKLKVELSNKIIERTYFYRLK